MTRSDAQGVPEAPPATLAWRSHPLVDDFPKSLLLVCVLAGVCVLVGMAFGGVGYGLLSAGMLGASLARYLLPTYFKLDADGVTVRLLGHAQHVRWSQIKRISVQRTGVFLSPFERRSRLDSFRGTFLRFADNGDEVRSFVESKVPLAA